jgi:hypothetical protein
VDTFEELGLKRWELPQGGSKFPIRKRHRSWGEGQEARLGGPGRLVLQPAILILVHLEDDYSGAFMTRFLRVLHGDPMSCGRAALANARPRCGL